MFKKTAMIAAAAALVLAVALIAIGDTGQATACDGKTKTASKSASSCTKTSTASAAKVASASGDKPSCSKTAQASCASMTKTASAACCAKMAKQAHYAQVKAAADNVPYRMNTRVVVAGTYTCGSCDLGMTDKCQAFLKTADGDLYPLKMDKQAKSIYKSGSKNIEVVARVTKAGGVKYLDVTSYKAL
jgi:hypothetical protein